MEEHRLESPERKRKRKDKASRHKHHRSSKEEEVTSRKKKRSRHETKHDKRHRKHRYDSDSAESYSSDERSSHSSMESDDDSSEDCRHRKKSSRRKKESRNRHKKHRKNRHKKSSLEDECKGKHGKKDGPEILFSDSLLPLLQKYPEMSTQVPTILLKMASGTTYDLSQMTDTRVANRLERVFSSLESYGVHRNGSIWKWHSSISSLGSNKRRDDLLLIRVVRDLLYHVGVTIAEIEKYEEDRIADKKSDSSIVKKEQKNGDIFANTSLLLQSFSEKNLSQPEQPSLAQELDSICRLVLDGEIVALDGIDNPKLRIDLQILFAELGLEKDEMENEDEDDDNNKSNATIGYCLPEVEGVENSSAMKRARANLSIVLEACSDFDSKSKTPPDPKLKGGKPTLGPARIEDSRSTRLATPIMEESDSDEEEGPSLPGKKPIGPGVPPEMIKAMAKKRGIELQAVMAGADPDLCTYSDPKVREEWMMKPGEHNFLQGIASTSSMKPRTFKNEKQRGGKEEDDDAAMTPQMRKEMESIRKIYQESRGLSLFEQHRQNLEEEKKSKGVSKEWKWDRTEDLDKDRKVDKNALGQILGGAADGLKNKFAGSFTSGFS